VRPALLRAADQPWRGGVRWRLGPVSAVQQPLDAGPQGKPAGAPDYSPIMGLSPVKNYYLDAGWGTWGFKATPICGKTMAELVASGGKVPELIKPFGLERFSTFQQVNEMGATAASH
ncbi:sarcosine oxidase subunit beta, partial [Pseudomonas syringae pv. actinidiae ICMP 18804]